MFVYDTANKLAEELRESKQYADLKKAKEVISQNTEKSNKLKEFTKLRESMQINGMSLEKADEESTMKLIKMYNELNKDEEIRNYFSCEMVFSQMIIDINKIIGDVVKDFL